MSAEFWERILVAGPARLVVGWQFIARDIEQVTCCRSEQVTTSFDFRMPCHVMSCHVTLCYVMLCHVML